MIKDIIIINNFYGFCSFLLYNHTLNNINSISLLLFWCEIVCYKTQIIVYFFWGTVRMPLFVREIWRHSHYISPNFGCVLLIVLRFFGWSPNLILLSIRYILYPLALICISLYRPNQHKTMSQSEQMENFFIQLTLFHVTPVANLFYVGGGGLK